MKFNLKNVFDGLRFKQRFKTLNEAGGIALAADNC